LPGGGPVHGLPPGQCLGTGIGIGLNPVDSSRPAAYHSGNSCRSAQYQRLHVWERWIRWLDALGWTEIRPGGFFFSLNAERPVKAELSYSRWTSCSTAVAANGHSTAGPT
jgi:hypothetical protein